jgi:hypothetical protein
MQQQESPETNAILTAFEALTALFELSELELCKRIARIEHLEFVEFENTLVLVPAKKVTMKRFYHELYDHVKAIYNKDHPYNPITDDALLMGLIKKHIQSYKYDVSISPEEETEMHCFTAFHGTEVRGSDYAKTALIAIIEALG